MSSKTVIAYRGEHGLVKSDGVFETRLGSLSFGSIKAAQTYATSPNCPSDEVISPRIYKAELNFENLAMEEPDDPFIEGSLLLERLGCERASEIIRDLSDHVFNTDNWFSVLEESRYNDSRLKHEEILAKLIEEGSEDFIKKIYLNAYPVFDNQKYIDWFKSEGYDGAIHGGNGETAQEAEYKIFDQSQAKVHKIMFIDEYDNSLKM